MDMKLYETEKHAQRAIDKVVKSMSVKFCPAFNDRCRTRYCMSFYPGGIRAKRVDGSCHIYIPNCTSPLVTGTIDHDVG